MENVFADVMLAKLARWLRLAGMPVRDAPYTDDARLLGFVERQGGVLLTSDEQLCARARKRGVRFVLLKQGRIEGQIALVASALGVKVTTEPAKVCPVCGSKLVRIGRKKARGLVPQVSYSRYRLFYFCRKCRKAYWHGTHWKRIRSRLARSRAIQKKSHPRSGSPRALRPR